MPIREVKNLELMKEKIKQKRKIESYVNLSLFSNILLFEGKNKGGKGKKGK